jgi:hypothetical protein
MLNQKLKDVFNKGLPTALLEVALIFVGITLAVGFENWNTERKERQDELALLVELRSNLEENLAILARGISYNEETVASYRKLLGHIADKRPYSDDLIAHFSNLDHWSSPYLTSSGYETLKSRGLDVISDGSLRQQIVKLFEVNYVLLAKDYDRTEWINYEVSMVPLMLKHFETQPDDTEVPTDYESLVEDQSFRAAVSRTLGFRRSGIEDLKESQEATTQVINSISKFTDI